MSKILITIGVATATFLMSCGGQQAVDPSVIAARVDSMASIKIEQANAAAIAECETRMTTEVKFMTDSILHARQMQNASH